MAKTAGYTEAPIWLARLDKLTGDREVLRGTLAAEQRKRLRSFRLLLVNSSAVLLSSVLAIGAAVSADANWFIPAILAVGLIPATVLEATKLRAAEEEIEKASATAAKLSGEISGIEISLGFKAS